MKNATATATTARTAANINVPHMDENGALVEDLMVGDLPTLPILPVPGFVIGDSPERRKSPRCRTTPLGGEPLPRFVERVPIDVQEAENRFYLHTSMLLVFMGLVLMAAPIGALIGGK